MCTEIVVLFSRWISVFAGVHDESPSLILVISSTDYNPGLKMRWSIASRGFGFGPKPDLVVIEGGDPGR